MAKQVLTHVEERDIDLLLVEELRCSTDFRTWFCEKIFGGKIQISDVLVLHSTSRTGADWGETDIEFHANIVTRDVTSSYTILIEDKIDSPFTVLQAERYRLACESVVGRKAIAILVCPQQHTTTHSIFNCVIHHEEIRDYFLQRAGSCGDVELTERLRHRAEIIECSITKSRRGYEKVVDNINTAFWDSYSKLIDAIAPELKINDGSKGGHAIDIHIKEGLPLIKKSKGRFLKHSLKNSKAMLEVTGWGAVAERKYVEIGKLLEDGMYPRTSGKSFQLIIEVPELDPQKTFDPQIEAATVGIEALQRLFAWTLRNSAALDQIAGD